jgi:hypothetical protein
MPAEEQKFYIRVCRPRFEVATIEVTAADHDDAESLARMDAAELSDDKWKLLPFDRKSYIPHAEEIWSDNDMGANADNETPKQELIREFMALEDERDQLYLLLMGDPTTGEGDVVFEPWCRSDAPELLEMDLSGDWIQVLENVFSEETGGAGGPDPSKNGSH